jgi:hypothetical protein
MLRDQLNLLHPVLSIAPVVQTNSDAAIVGAIVDSLNFGAVTYMIALGTLTDPDATFAVTLDVGDVANLSDAAAAPVADLIGMTGSAGATTATALQNAAFTFANDLVTRKLGYVGNKRYSRLTITPTGNNAGAAPVSAIAVLGYPTFQPTINPPG